MPAITINTAKDSIHGAWVRLGEHSDAHVYELQDSFVIGWNKDTRGMQFTPLALVFQKTPGENMKGSLMLQRTSETGQCEQLENICPKLVGEAITEFLQKIESAVLASRS